MLLLWLAFFRAWTLADAASLRLLRATPQHTHISIAYTNVTFLCEADGPLDACQFRWRNEIRKRNGPVLDLSLGLDSPLNRSSLTKDVVWYHYSGEGLAAGQCGVTLYMKGVKQYTVGCRVRAHDSGWRYGLMALYAENYGEVPLEVTSMQEVAVGDEVNLLCKAPRQLKTCRFYLPGFGEVIMDKGRESPSPSTHQYYGAGLQEGECGLTLKAKETNNGMLWCTVDSSRRDLEWNTIPLIVTRPPEKVNLEVVNVMLSPEATVFQARCSVGESRPAANITWLLGDTVLREDGENDDVNATWIWPYHPQAMSQVLNVTLEAGAAPQTLTCKAQHSALTEPLVDAKELAPQSTHCTLMDTESVTATCELNGEEVNCNNVVVGTIARMSCKPGYVRKGHPRDGTWQCLLGGVWNQTLLKCLPDCGRLGNRSAELPEQEDGQMDQFPWHVGIYEQHNETFKYICGGTLISTKFVISAAQCFWDPVLNQTRNGTRFIVKTGQGSREWSDEGDRRNVSQIVFHDRFAAFLSKFMYDIALLRLDKEVPLTDSVNIACMDWDGHWERAQLQENSTGLVVSQAFTEDGSVTESLQYVNMTFVQNSTCYDAIPEVTRYLLTEDKFCARADNEERGLCLGDVGGGLLFLEPSSRKFFLRGIASVGFKPSPMEAACQENYYIGYTSVGAYLDWVKDVV